MAKALFSFHWDCGRMGDLNGRFVLDDEEQARLEKAYGSYINFGEVLGKHSEITGTLERGEVVLVTDNQEFLEMAERLGVSLDMGFNPLDYLEDDEDEEEEEDEDEDEEEGAPNG